MSKVTVKEGEVDCPKCKGAGMETQRDGTSKTCWLCGGSGRVTLHNEIVVK